MNKKILITLLVLITIVICKTPFAHANGFVFKPISEGDRKLVILLPTSFSHRTSAMYLNESNCSRIETGRSVGRTNGNRETFRFQRPGAQYPANIVVEVSLKDGTTQLYDIPSPSRRYENLTPRSGSCNSEPGTSETSGPGTNETFELIDLGGNNVALKAANDTYVCILPDGRAAAFWDDIGTWETFKRVDLGIAHIALQAHTGNYLVVLPNGEIGAYWAAMGNWEAFELEDKGDNNITLKTYHDNYVSAQSGGGDFIVSN